MEIYLITVILCSLLFLSYLCYKGHLFGISVKGMIIFDGLICLAIVILPVFLTRNIVFLWFLLIVVYLFIVGTILYRQYAPESRQDRRRRRRKRKRLKRVRGEEISAAAEEEEKPEEPVVAAIEEEKPEEPVAVAEVEEQPEEPVVAAIEEEQPEEPVAEAEGEEQPEESLDELINRGFAAKSSGRLEEAAALFAEALELKPTPDIAYYLIIDAYQMGTTGLENADLVRRLSRHCAAYKDILPPDMKEGFREWMLQQKLFSK
ncbi:MAG: prominin family protein [Peptococcaceae bacterium]|jgi:tetratricopeptide (TPR) repeat protein|nr:prominin family protein [Peptococcaceae bacterium]